MINRKKIRLIAVIAAICATAIMLSSCSDRFVSEGPAYRDKETDVLYKYAPFCYEAIETAKEVYAEAEFDSFYEIVGADPLTMLCESSGTIFYSEKFVLPTLNEMNISYIEICAEGSTVVAKAKIDDPAHISSIINSYSTEQPLDYMGDVAETTYKIRFTDPSLGLYYSVTFLRYADGGDYLYNRAESRFVKAPDELVAYVNGI